ncbi:MAG: carboxypeptidase regulatory-like domain-containing protein [Rubrivivax sp.]|nr:carboxypeptidase regulatory-like domain-containing protein [Rubrivivax sp.]
MNPSFSILQKLKQLFLATVTDPEQYQVAFAPFAFTLDNDDFYFLKGDVATGAQAQKYRRTQSEFAVIANSVPERPHLWSIESSRLLYNLYKEVLEHAAIIDPDALGADEQERMDKARAVLYTPEGAESAEYTRYKACAERVRELEEQLIEHRAARSTLAATDAIDRWEARLATLEGRRRELQIEWQVVGAKSAIDAAKAAYEALFRRGDFVQRWQDARNVKTGDTAVVTDDVGQEFLPTGCVPSAIAEAGAPIWQQVSLPRAEIGVLARSFGSEVPEAVRAMFGELAPELISIRFGYCLLDLVRPWFEEALLRSRLWTLPDGSLLSTGDASLQGRLPAYPVKLILVKDVELKFDPAAAVNGEIRKQLREGSRLLFGPLLLKTIPANLADDRVTDFRVQQMSKSELQVLTHATQRVAPGAGATMAAPQPPAAPVPAPAAPGRPASPTIARVQSTAMLAMLQARPQLGAPAKLERSLSAIKGERTTLARPSPLAAAAPRQMSAASMSAIGLVMRPPGPAVIVAPRPTAAPPPRPVPSPTPSPAPSPAPTSPPAPPAAPVRVSGKVVSSANELLPIAEIQLTHVESGVVQCVLSDEAGAFAFASVPPGRYQFIARKRGYQAVERTSEVRGPSSQEFLLEPQPAPMDTFQLIGVVCKRLPRLPDPLPGARYL